MFLSGSHQQLQGEDWVWETPYLFGTANSFNIQTIPQKAEQHWSPFRHSSCNVQNWVQFSGSALQGGGSRMCPGTQNGKEKGWTPGWSNRTPKERQKPKELPRRWPPWPPSSGHRAVKYDVVLSCCLALSSKQGKPELGCLIKGSVCQNPTSIGHSPPLHIRCQVPRDPGCVQFKVMHGVRDEWEGCVGPFALTHYVVSSKFLSSLQMLPPSPRPRPSTYS